MRNHFCRILFFGLFMLAASNVANAQSYTITIVPPAKEQAPKVKMTDEDLDEGWNYSLPNQEPQYFLVNPWQQMIFMPAVARPRVWTNPNLKMKVKVRNSY